MSFGTVYYAVKGGFLLDYYFFAIFVELLSIGKILQIETDNEKEYVMQFCNVNNHLAIRLRQIIGSYRRLYLKVLKVADKQLIWGKD